MNPWPIGIAMVAILLFLGAAYWLYQWYQKKQKAKGPAARNVGLMSAGVYWAVVWGVLWLVSAFWFAFLCVEGLPLVPGGAGKGLLFAWFLLSGVAGGAAGWLAGVFFFPTDSSEAQAFNKITTVV